LARESIEKIISIAPADEEARLELANLLIQAGEDERAVQQVEELIKVNPKSKAGLEALFKASLTKKQWDKAQDIASRFQQAYPDEGMGFFLSGLAYQAEGKIEVSIPAFEQALAKQPDAVEPLTQLIKSYLALKKNVEALVKLNQITKEQPKNFVAYNLLGSVYLQDKQYADAINAFKKASTIKPDWPIPYRMIAVSYDAQGKKAEAIRSFQEGITNTNSSLELVNDLVGIYSSDGEHEKAIALYEGAYKLHPDSLEILNNLTSYLSDYAKDKVELERAAKLAEPLANLENPNALDTVGWIAYKLGDYAKAETYLLKVITALPNSPISNYHLGMIYYKQNNIVKAKEHLQKAMDQKSEFIGVDVAKETLKLLDGTIPAKK
jgi:tetratricopeptide (TPR) repeat protein